NRDTDKTDTVAVELRLDRIPRLYNSLDPAPFHEKELEAAADGYIVGSAEDAGGRPTTLVATLARGGRRRGPPDTAGRHAAKRRAGAARSPAGARLHPPSFRASARQRAAAVAW